jgi:hypothetical protein
VSARQADLLGIVDGVASPHGPEDAREPAREANDGDAFAPAGGEGESPLAKRIVRIFQLHDPQAACTSPLCLRSRRRERGGEGLWIGSWNAIYDGSESRAIGSRRGQLLPDGRCTLGGNQGMSLRPDRAALQSSRDVTRSDAASAVTAMTTVTGARARDAAIHARFDATTRRHRDRPTPEDRYDEGNRYPKSICFLAAHSCS